MIPVYARSQASKDVDSILHAVTVMDAVPESAGLADAILLGLTSFPRQGAYRHWTRSNTVLQATPGEPNESLLVDELGVSVQEIVTRNEQGVIGNRAVLNA